MDATESTQRMAALERRLDAGEWADLGCPSVDEGRAAEDMFSFLAEAVACHVDPKSEPEQYEQTLSGWVDFCFGARPGGEWPGLPLPWWLQEDDPASLSWSDPAS